MLCVVVMLAAMLVTPASAARRAPSSPSGSPNQTIYIHSELNPSMVVDVNGNRNKNGTKIQLWSQSKNDGAVQFVLRYADTGSWYDGWYYIMKKGTNMCLDVTGGVAKSGVNVQLYEFNGTDAQKWYITPDWKM